jgi:hypothetical protein
MVEYFVPSHGIFFHVENEYTMNIPLCGMEYFQRFSHVHMNMLTSSPTSIIEQIVWVVKQGFLEVWTLKSQY